MGEWLTLRQAVIVRCNKIQWGQSEYSWAGPGTWWLQVNPKVFVCRNGQWLHVFSSSRFLKVMRRLFSRYTRSNARYAICGGEAAPSLTWNQEPEGAIVRHQLCHFRTGKTRQPFLQNTLFWSYMNEDLSGKSPFLRPLFDTTSNVNIGGSTHSTVMFPVSHWWRWAYWGVLFIKISFILVSTTFVVSGCSFISFPESCCLS